MSRRIVMDAEMGPFNRGTGGSAVVPCTFVIEVDDTFAAAYYGGQPLAATPRGERAEGGARGEAGTPLGAIREEAP